MQFYSKKIFLMLRINFIEYLPFLVDRFVGLKQTILCSYVNYTPWSHLGTKLAAKKMTRRGRCTFMQR